MFMVSLFSHGSKLWWLSSHPSTSCYTIAWSSQEVFAKFIIVLKFGLLVKFYSYIDGIQILFQFPHWLRYVVVIVFNMQIPSVCSAVRPSLHVSVRPNCVPVCDFGLSVCLAMCAYLLWSRCLTICLSVCQSVRSFALPLPSYLGSSSASQAFCRALFVNI